MARIRSLKPDFFMSESVGAVSFGARLLFAGLWTIADRSGRLVWKPNMVRLYVFPHDDKPDIAGWAEELVRQDMLRFYQDSERTYAWLPHFTTHQRPHPKEPASVIPPWPDQQDKAWLPWQATTRREKPGSIPSSPVGREGKGTDQEGDRERTSPPPTSARGSLIARGENLHFAQQQSREHAKHHPEVCSSRDPAVRVCMPSGQVAQFAEKLLGVPPAAAIARVVAWARAHVPTDAELPANLFAYWDRQWDARRPTKRSDVPDVDETRRMIEARERMART